MRRHEQEFRRLVQIGTIDAERVRILQKAGLLMIILAAIIARKVGPIIDRLANRIISTT